MWIRLFVGLSAIEGLIIYFLQADIVSPDSLMVRILEQYPPLAVVLIVVYWLRKTQREDARENNDRLEKMLELQRLGLKEIYEGQREFMASLISQMEVKQNRMSDRIELLTQQMAVNTETVNEISKVDSIVEMLINRLENK